MRSYARIGIVLSALSALLAPAAFAGQKAAAKTETKGREKAVAKHETKTEEGKEVTLSGKVVDVVCFATGMSTGDHAKCTSDCLKSGVPGALETSKGLVILGKGHKGAGEMLAAHAWQNVKIKGKLYEKGGIKYLSIDSIEKSGIAAVPATESEVPAKATKSKPPARTGESKTLARATEAHRSVRIYPPGELSKTLARPATPAKTPAGKGKS